MFLRPFNMVMLGGLAAFLGVAYTFLVVNPQIVQVNTFRGTLKIQKRRTQDTTIDLRKVTNLKASHCPGNKSFRSEMLEIYTDANDKKSKTKIKCASVEDARWLKAQLGDLIRGKGDD